MDALMANYGSEDDASGSDEDKELSQQFKREPEMNILHAKAEPSRPSLFGKLPPPKSAGASSKQADVGKGNSIFAALPPPKKDAVPIVKAEPGLESGLKKRKAVQVQLPFSSSILKPSEDGEDDDWRPPKKVATAEAKVAEGEAPKKEGGAGKGLFACLPPPKHSQVPLGGGVVASSQRISLDDEDWKTSTTLEQKTSPRVSSSLEAGPPDAAGSLEVGAGDGGWGTTEPSAAYVPDPEEWIHRQADSTSYPAAPEAGAGPSVYDGRGSGVAYGAAAYDVAGSYSSAGLGRESFQQQPWGALPEDTSGALAKALAADEERMRRRGKGKDAPQYIEVKQASLLGGHRDVREDKARLTGIAFGPVHQAAAAAASEKKPDKVHRRKHQIGSLYYDLKQRELEMLERRAKGMMSKAETHAKYGW